jgi:hypothetical protein
VEEDRKENLRSDEQFIYNKQRKEKDGPDPEKIGRIDLDSPMPHYLDEIDSSI